LKKGKTGGNAMTNSSEFKGFYKLSPEQRLAEVAKFSDLSADEVALLSKTGALDMQAADHMIENVFSIMPLPMGVAVNFKINGKDYLIPMAVEEPSVVAAASNAAGMARVKGGFFASNASANTGRQCRRSVRRQDIVVRSACAAHGNSQRKGPDVD
jgi:degradative hydroxymethylglutaryl-CoA reductase